MAKNNKKTTTSSTVKKTIIGAIGVGILGAIAYNAYKNNKDLGNYEDELKAVEGK